MNSSSQTKKENIREIEDVINLQKANGNFNMRQVTFDLPSEKESTLLANLAKSLESGLFNYSSTHKKNKKVRSKRCRSPLPDVISWPSDSDITVIRMQLCLNSKNLKEKIANIPGDGLHQTDSSSMINLATLMRQSQPQSKHSLNIEEYLLPLTSWELQDEEEKELTSKNSTDEATGFNKTFQTYEAHTAQKKENVDPRDRDEFSNSNKKSKVARFLRLYFCPCCACLYKIEKMKDNTSTYFTKRRN